MSVDWFHSLGPWQGEGEFDLSLMKSFCDTLGHVEDAIPIFHVAGTNGKGSVSSAIAAINGHAGFHVGLNSSPHLHNARERFLIDGLPVPYPEFEAATIRLKLASDLLGQVPSFHEGATLLAFILFSQLDRAVFEVGLGGRLDASNVISQPLVAIITSIGLDHQAILGDSLEKIAREKAGIIKSNVPVVVGDVADTAFAEIEKFANIEGAACYRYGRDFTVRVEGNVYRYKGPEEEFSFESGLSGIVQRSNLGCALMACALSGIDISRHHAGLAQLFWPGRLESVVYSNKNVLIDCAHNLQGISALLTELKYRALKEVVFMFGILQRPDLETIVELLADTPHHFVLLTPPSARSVAAIELRRLFLQHGKEAVEFDSHYVEALKYVQSHPCRQVVLAGSMYLVGAVREMLAPTQQPVWIRE